MSENNIGMGRNSKKVEFIEPGEMMDIKKDLGNTYGKLTIDNQRRIDLIADLLKPGGDIYNTELAMVYFFKIFEDELRENVFWKMIREDRENDVNMLMFKDESREHIDYNIRVLTIVKEECKRSGYNYIKRNDGLVTYLLNPRKEDYNIPYSAMLYAFKCRRAWHNEILGNQFKDFNRIFYFEKDNNQTHFFKKMVEIKDVRNHSTHEAVPFENEEIISGIKSTIFLLNELHSQIKH